MIIERDSDGLMNLLKSARYRIIIVTVKLTEGAKKCNRNQREF